MVTDVILLKYQGRFTAVLLVINHISLYTKQPETIPFSSGLDYSLINSMCR